MNRRRKRGRTGGHGVALATLCSTAVLAGTMSGGEAAQEKGGAPVGASLEKVAAHCPQHYPESVIPLPDHAELAALSTPDLMRMLESWNPALRRTAATGLADRGDEVVPVLEKATGSDSAAVRAGAAAALAGLVNHQLRNWKECYPAMTDQALAQQKIKVTHAALIERFIALTRDPQRDVRSAALTGLASLTPDSPDAKRAVLSLFSDPDEHLANQAVITFQKQFSIEGLNADELIPALQTAMRAPLPRGRGHAMMIINGLDEQAQRQFIPVLLDHLDWQPDRDTMFGASAQADAVKMLTRFKVQELVPRLPGLMTKTMRGPGLFEPCMDSALAFGKDAQGILPELQAYRQELEESLATAHPRYKEGINTKLQRLREVVQHVQGL